MQEQRTEGSGERGTYAQQLRQRFRWLQSFTDDELHEMSWCSAGLELQPAEQYIDLSRPGRGVITVERPVRVRDGECYVSRTAVSDRVWRKLARFGS